MGLVEAIVLGLVQGLTEFLPISSSGHLVIAEHLLGDIETQGILFEVLLHLGSLTAVFFYFRKELLSIAHSFFPLRGRMETGKKEKRKIVLAVVIGTIPTVAIALAFRDVFEKSFESLQTVSVMLLVTGLLLYLSDMAKGAKRVDVGIVDAVIIGSIQGMAIIPGISRSGSTIATGIFRGVKGESAATFSFLLSIPAILGAAILESRGISGISAQDIPAYAAGVASAAISGFFGIKVLMKVVAGRNLKIFAFYCWTIGTISLFLGA